MDSLLIDAIYEAAFLPQTWPSVLDRLAVIAEARGGVVFTANPGVGILKTTASAAIGEAVERYSEEGWLFRGARLAKLIATPHAGFVVERDLYTDEELDSDPTYRDFLRPLGLGRAAGTALPLPTGDVAVLSLEREGSRGEVKKATIERLDRLRPHLARSLLMAARLQLTRAEQAAATLALLGLPAIVLDRAGRAIAANPLVDDLPGLRWRARDRLALSDGVADGQLKSALTALDASSPAVCSFAVRGGDGGEPMIAHLVPVRGEARDLFSGAAALLVLTPITLPGAPPVELIRSLFDLTPAEARVARSLAEGETLDRIAASGGVSRNTVRSHLRAVLEKTGSRRQQDVVALLSRMMPGR